MQVSIRKTKNGKRLDVINHEGQFFAIAPTKGSYEIELYNNCPRRRLAVVSVDGLSVIDGKPAAHNSDGYVLNPYQRLTITGWRRDDKEVARFEFTPSPESYGAQMGHGEKNNGVIGVAVFEEESRWGPAVHIVQHWYSTPLWYPMPYNENPTPGWSDHVTCSVESQSVSFCSNREVKTAGGLDFRGGSRNVRRRAASKSIDVGTGYGERAEMAVRHVTFNRLTTSPSVIITIRYNTKERLREMGVPVDTHRDTVAEETGPQAFPAAQCPAPPGWKG